MKARNWKKNAWCRHTYMFNDVVDSNVQDATIWRHLLN